MTRLTADQCRLQSSGSRWTWGLGLGVHFSCHHPCMCPCVFLSSRQQKQLLCQQQVSACVCCKDRTQLRLQCGVCVHGQRTVPGHHEGQSAGLQPDQDSRLWSMWVSSDWLSHWLHFSSHTLSKQIQCIFQHPKWPQARSLPVQTGVDLASLCLSLGQIECSCAKEEEEHFDFYLKTMENISGCFLWFTKTTKIFLKLTSCTTLWSSCSPVWLSLDHYLILAKLIIGLQWL